MGKLSCEKPASVIRKRSFVPGTLRESGDWQVAREGKAVLPYLKRTEHGEKGLSMPMAR